jgi:hypothetical protein
MTSNEEENADSIRTRARALVEDQANRAIALRSEEREFHGLEREFRNHQAQMLADYERTKDIKHPRDLGDTREQILRKFLSTSGYLPKRYAISDRSVRVASTAGHISKEIDIAIYDALDCISLMDREGVYQVLPIESVFGVIQVKSRLTKATIRDGLANLVSFKSLDRQTLQQSLLPLMGGQAKTSGGFGVLFAYATELDWVDLVAEIEEFAALHKPREWSNFVYVLNTGLIFHGEANVAAYQNEELEAIQSLKMQGRPDFEGFGLYNFYSLLLSLLRNTQIMRPDVDTYFRLPFVDGKHSYSFGLGSFREFGVCEKHGDYRRRIAPEKLESIINWCRTSKPINWVRAHHLAYGLPGDEAAYQRQPGDVYIYNPKGLPLSEILTCPTKIDGLETRALAYDPIESASMAILVPWYYSVLEGLISECPKCQVK